jgi:GNAT superfamily N-acetyltransferase
MADVSVRPARATDAEAAARAQLASWAEDGVIPAGVLAAASVSELAAAWAEAIVRPPSSRHRVLVAVDAEVVVGVAATAPHDDPDADPRDEGALMALTVAPVARGRGHGSRLLAAAVDTLRDAGFGTAYAWVPDERGLDFLVQAGWAEDGARRTLDLDGTGTVLAEEIRLVTDVRVSLADAPT